MIGDKKLFSNNNKAHVHAHRQLSIRGGYMAYEELIDVKRERVNDKYFRLGTFNHARKLSKNAIKLFSEIMSGDELIKLVLKSINFDEKIGRENMMQELLINGIPREQVEILPWVQGRKAHLECYKYIDIALDPFPYGGAAKHAKHCTWVFR